MKIQILILMVLVVLVGCKTKPPAESELITVDQYTFNRQAYEDLTNYLNTNMYWLRNGGITYKDCDVRVDTNWVISLAERTGTNFIGVYMDMAAVRHPTNGVSMFSTCQGYQGEYMKDITYEDFESIFVNKTRPEYLK